VKCEIRIVSGARAGHRELLDKPYIGLGRHPLSDVRFDAEQDIDASTRHAAILLDGSQYVLRDLGSTNGTFVNGQRVAGDVPLKDGDVIRCGVHGPELAFTILRDQEEQVMDAVRRGTGSAAPAAGQPRPGAMRPTAAPPPRPAPHPSQPPAPSKTSVLRAEIAAQRSRFRAVTAFLLIVLVGSASVLMYTNQQAAKARDAAVLRADSLARFVGQMQAARQQADSAIKALHAELAAETDPARRRTLQVEMSGVVSRRANIERSIASADDVDYNAILRNNRAAVAVLTVELEGDTSEFFTGTGFCISPDGKILTNRHVVAGEHGNQRATRIAVQFSGSAEVLRARVVRVLPDVDLALVQITDPGPFPVVQGLAQDAAPEPGNPIVLMGFPGYGGTDSIPRATLVTGSIADVVTDSLLRLDAYSGGGASGSPILDRTGRVIGIEFGGLVGSAGRAILGLPIRRAMALVSP